MGASFCARLQPHNGCKLASCSRHAGCLLVLQVGCALALVVGTGWSVVVLGRVAAFAVVAAVSCMTPRLLGPRAHPGLVCPQPAEPQRAAVVRAQGHWRASRGHPVSAPGVVRVSAKLGEVREES